MSIKNNNSNSEHLELLKKKVSVLKEDLINHLNHIKEDYTLSEDDFIEMKEIAKIELKELTSQIDVLKRELESSFEKRAPK